MSAGLPAGAPGDPAPAAGCRLALRRWRADPRAPAPAAGSCCLLLGAQDPCWLLMIPAAGRLALLLAGSGC